MRKIDDILHFRNDISPFLTHLTRDKGRLDSILNDSFLKSSNGFVSSIVYGLDWGDLGEEERKIFQAVCFTETPLGEINSLIEIRNRQVNLSNYGLVFIKDRLKRKGVSPVFYLNNDAEDHTDTLVELQKMIKENPNVAKKILPLFTHFGSGDKGELQRRDFTWEREWRFPAYRGNFTFEPADIFIGLCPDENIDNYEAEFGEKFILNETPLKFIDPLKPNRWYATKLVQSRKRIGSEYSVV